MEDGNDNKNKKKCNHDNYGKDTDKPTSMPRKSFSPLDCNSYFCAQKMTGGNRIRDGTWK